jgi:PAS domain S-box-containing protein
MSSELQFPELLVHSPDAVLLLDRDAVVLDANAEALRGLGYERSELVGRHVRDIVDGLDGETLLRVQQHMRETGVATFRAAHRRKDGTGFPVEARLALVRREGAPSVVVAFVRDLTEQEAVRTALRASEERYRLLMDLLPEGVVTYGRDGRVTFANAAAARLVGAARAEDLIGTPVLDRVHPSSLAAVTTRISAALAGAPAPPLEERLVRLDGSVFEAEVASAAADPAAVMVVFRDVSERRRAEAERHALEERLRQAEKLEALGTLAGGVAHDFNNVLAAILGHADALSGELPPGSVGREDAEQIAAAARRAKGVVQQILAFARRRPAEVALLDVPRTIREELPLVRAATPANVEISLQADEGAGAVRADPTQLHQILLNLSANARDAMAYRGGVLRILVDRAEVPGPDVPPGLAPGSYVRLVVSDTGTGMDAATRARAFEPYFTTKPLGAGSGLGLSVVHGIAAGLGGGVRLESVVGEGTRAEVWLPRLASGPAPQPAPQAPAADGGRRPLLLVDDDPPVARAMARMLTSIGYEVTVAETAEKALERFRSDPDAFEVVLTDQTLPGMGGDELTLALLAVRPSLPVLICSGYSARLDEAEARGVGARALLPKPIDRRQLAEALAAALRPRS